MKVLKTSSILIVIVLFLVSGLVGEAIAARSSVGRISLSMASLKFQGIDPGDWTGFSVAPAGDVNQDGYADILIGAPKAGVDDPISLVGEGKTYLFLGGPNREWPASPVNLASADASFIGCNKESRTGYQVYTAGDVNGDGYDDFLITGGNCVPNLGAQVFLFLGDKDISWGKDFLVSNADAFFYGESKILTSSLFAASAGDVNGDGLDDFLIADYLDDEVAENSGKVYLILGRAAANWGQYFQLGNAEVAFLGVGADSQAGRTAIGAGDVNGDGLDDILIGARGKVYLILGREDTDYWGKNYSLANVGTSFIPETTGDPLALNVEFGRRAAGVGDVNGDGFDDFLVGAPDNDQGGSDAGKSYLFLGKANVDWGKNFPAEMADAAFIGELNLDRSGRRVSGAGDVNQDGLDDMLIASHTSRLGGIGSGTVYLVLGRTAADWGRTFSLSRADRIYIGEAEGLLAGSDIAGVGDFNGDSLDDLLIGAYGGEGSDSPGKAYLITGQEANYSVFLPQVIH